MNSSPEDSGPYPLGDRQDLQEQLSLNALRYRLPADKFLFRDVRADDKGVDFVLEAKVEVRVPKKSGGEEIKYQFRNCFAQAQLKSFDSEERNQDGSVSYPVTTSNLNQLLNGQCPIYFLWIVPTNEVRYAWAREEWRRLDSENTDWKSQGKFTIRFRDVLDGAAVDSIHERILSEARFERSIHEALARSAPSETVTVSIDSTTLKTTDPRQVYEWLTTSGMTIVSAGYGLVISDWYALLNPDARREARVRLVVGFAEASLGKYLDAISHLAAAAIRQSDLSEKDSQFLAYLRGACDYYTGTIDVKEYLRRESELADRLTGAHAATHRLEVLRQERLRERDQPRRVSLLAEIRASAAEILRAPDASETNKLQARIILLDAEGDVLGTKFVEDVLIIQTRQAIGRSVDRISRDAMATAKVRWSEWEAEARRVIDAAKALKAPLLLADAIAVRLTIYVAMLQFQQMDSIWNERPFTLSQEQILALMCEAQQAMEIYAKATNLEGETRAKLLLADLFDLQGQRSAAKNLAEAALIVAEAMRYPGLLSLARERIDDQTMVQQFLAKVKERKAADEDVLLANETDEGLRGPARHSLDSLALPLDRLPVLEREWVYYRLIARERVGWCRYLDLLQGSQYALPRSELYLTDPPRVCQCLKHGYKQKIECVEGEEAVSTFKKTFCEGCPDREPKSRVARN